MFTKKGRKEKSFKKIETNTDFFVWRAIHIVKRPVSITPSVYKKLGYNYTKKDVITLRRERKRDSDYNMMESLKIRLPRFKKGRKADKFSQDKTNRDLFKIFDLTPTKKDIRHQFRCLKKRQ